MVQVCVRGFLQDVRAQGTDDTGIGLAKDLRPDGDALGSELRARQLRTLDQRVVPHGKLVWIASRRRLLGREMALEIRQQDARQGVRSNTLLVVAREHDRWRWRERVRVRRSDGHHTVLRKVRNDVAGGECHKELLKGRDGRLEACVLLRPRLLPRLVAMQLGERCQLAVHLDGQVQCRLQLAKVALICQHLRCKKRVTHSLVHSRSLSLSLSLSE